MTVTPAAPSAADASLVNETEAERITSLSGKTLHRLHQRGEPVGRVRIGRTVRYHRQTLVRWVESRLAAGGLSGRAGNGTG
jgi:predicted DNA-binding transcriptional regulator AlpA